MPNDRESGQASDLWLEAHVACNGSRDDMWDWLEDRYWKVFEQLETLRDLGRETSTFLFEWPLDGIYESEDEAKEDMRDLRVRWLHALGIPTPGVSNPAISPQPVRYEADREGRLYVEYDNGEILPTGKVSRAFAGKSDITPERYAELFPARERP